MKVKVAQLCPTLCEPMDTRLLCPWDFLGKGTGVGCHFLLQGIFPTQGSSPGLLHCKWILYQLSHQGRILEWVAYPFCSGFSRPRNRSGLSYIADRFCIFRNRKALGLRPRCHFLNLMGMPPSSGPFLGTAAVCSGFLSKGHWKLQLRRVVSWPSLLC